MGLFDFLKPNLKRERSDQSGMDENEYQLVCTEIIKKLLKQFSDFEALVEKKWGSVYKAAANELVTILWGSISKDVSKEYLTFLMFCVTDTCMRNGSGKLEIDNLHKLFYREVLKEGILELDELPDYEVRTRQRYSDYYETIGSELTGETMGRLIAKETLYLEELLSKVYKAEKADFGDLYTHVASNFMGLQLATQVLLSSLS